MQTIILHVKLTQPQRSSKSLIIINLKMSDALRSETIAFSLGVQTSEGLVNIPQLVPNITLSGRQSKVIVADYAFGKSRILYSTASIFFAGQIGQRDVVFLYGDSDQEHETSLALSAVGTKTTNSNISFTNKDNTTTVTFLAGIKGLVTVFESDTQLVLYSDGDTAGTFFAPLIPSSDSGDRGTFKNYWQIGSNTTVLVGGPYLVRNASITGSTLELRGDLNATVILTVIAPPQVREVTWNGQVVDTMQHAKSSAILEGQIRPKSSLSGIAIPKLSDWRYADSLPEIKRSFSDNGWTVANHTTTNIPFKPYYGDGRVLYGCDYEL